MVASKMILHGIMQNHRERASDARNLYDYYQGDDWWINDDPDSSDLTEFGSASGNPNETTQSQLFFMLWVFRTSSIYSKFKILEYEW